MLAAIPEQVIKLDGTQQRSRTLQFAELQLTPRDILVTVVSPDGTRGWFKATADHHIFDHDHEYVGTIDQLVPSFFLVSPYDTSLLRLRLTTRRAVT